VSGAGVRIGVGTRVMYDGALHEVTEWLPTVCGTDVVLRGPHSVCRMSVVDLVSGTRVRLLTDSSGPESTDQMVPAAVVLSSLPTKRLEEVQGPFRQNASAQSRRRGLQSRLRPKQTVAQTIT